MVLPDWTTPRPPKLEFEKAAPDTNASAGAMARPLDRLAAAIVDIFILLIPIYILLSAPMKRVLTSSFILGADSDFARTLIVMVVLALCLIMAYQALGIYYFGATIGKMLFELRVRPVFPEERLGLGACFARSVFWIVEIVLLGLPLLEIFSNRQRRALHDRLSDTCVVAVGRSGVGAPLKWERGLIRGFFAACVLFVFMVVTVQIHFVLDKMKMDSGLAALIDREEADCEVVSQYLPEDADGEHARLELGMSLYAAGLTERSCLESEIEREMSRQTPAGPVTYLAQAFVNADDAEISNSYLDQVCEESPSTVECAMSKVVSRWSDEDWESVEGLLAGAEPGSGYLEVWAVRHYMKQAKYGQALTFLDTLIDHRALADFTQTNRVKALYNSYLAPEAEAALAQALITLPKEDGEDLSAWMCAQQLQGGCSALERVACRGVSATKEVREIEFEVPSVALSRIMALECHGEQGMDYLTFTEAVHDEDWKTFFRANLKHQKADNHAAYKLYAEVITSNSAPEVLRVEAIRRLAQFATRQQLASAVDMWHSFESRESWIKAGNMLFARFADKKDRDWAMRVARHLMNSEALSPKSIAMLTDFSREPKPERQPASARPTEDLKFLLDSYEEEQ